MVEAAASGLPVIASDIPVHREIAEEFALFRDPLDGLGWLGTIEAFASPAFALQAELADAGRELRAPGLGAPFRSRGPMLAAL